MESIAAGTAGRRTLTNRAKFLMPTCWRKRADTARDFRKPARFTRKSKVRFENIIFDDLSRIDLQIGMVPAEANFSSKLPGTLFKSGQCGKIIIHTGMCISCPTALTKKLNILR